MTPSWRVVGLIWLAIGLADAVRYRLTLVAQDPTLDFAMALERAMPDALGWALLTPIPLFLARRYPLRKPHFTRDILLHLGAALLVSAIHVLYDVGQNMFFDAVNDRETSFRQTFGYIAPYNSHANVFVYAAIVGLWRMWDATRRLDIERSRSAVLQQNLAESRLRSLQARLRPHFLFNALHTGAGLVERDPRAARALLQRLGDLLRQSLTLDSRLEVTLKEEIEFVRAYLEVEAQRFGDRLRFRIDVASDVDGCLLPPFLLQPMVENAVKHGIEQCSQGGLVEVLAEREGSNLVLQVNDDGPGVQAPSGEGVGLSTTQARLSEMYGEAATLALIPRDPVGTSVKIVIPARSERDGELPCAS